MWSRLKVCLPASRSGLKAYVIPPQDLHQKPVSSCLDPDHSGGLVVYPVRGKMELEAMSRYTSLVNPAVIPHLTVVLLAISMFFIYEVTSTKYTRDIYKELLISLVASLFMGFGILFLLLWVGIYV